MLYANLVGGQDELVFDGASFAVDAQGALAWQGPFFAEAEAVLEWREGSWQPHAPCFDPLPPEEEL
jgi:NAD+ synthase/NAD+ synthase (glutamine-hydrolysing)